MSCFQQVNRRLPGGLEPFISKRPDVFAIGRKGDNLVLEVISPSQNTLGRIERLRDKARMITDLAGGKSDVFHIGDLSHLVT